MKKFTLKLLYSTVISLCFFTILGFFSSCKNKIEEVENICTLTVEQAPEVRGLKLGMTQEQIEKKFPNLFEENFNFSGDEIKTTDLITTYYRVSDPNQRKRGLKVLSASSHRSDISIDSQKYPQFDGVWRVILMMLENRLEGFNLQYLSTTDVKFTSVFKYKVVESLMLSSWTNWESVDPYFPSYTLAEQDKLLCNNVIFTISVLTNMSNISGEKSMKFPSLTIKTSTESATSKILQQQEEKQEEKQKEENKNAEEKRRTETFTP